jgi:hypothetical protein
MEEHNTEDSEEMPIFGLQINDGIDAPFADLYLDTFPEYYDVE